MPLFLSKIGVPLVLAGWLLVLGGREVRGQDFPDFPIVYDAFSYAPNVYSGAPPKSEFGEVFGPNEWITPTGADTSRGWYYFNFREDCSMPYGRIEVTADDRVVMTGLPGLERKYTCEVVPPHFQFGLVQPTGTWMALVRLTDPEARPLDQIRPVQVAFWLHSGHTAAYGDTPIREWTELNFEWQNAFALDGRFLDGSPHNDRWASNNWPGSRRLSKQSYSGEVKHESQRVTYMANGVRVYEEDSDALVETPNNGGLPLRNPRLKDSSSEAVNFTCYSKIGEMVIDEDPLTCMDRFTKSLDGDRVDDPNHFVALMIEHDGAGVKFRAVIPTFGTGFTYSERVVEINRRLQPMIPIFSIFPSGTNYQLVSEISLELHYFVYTPETGLDFFEIHAAAESFRQQKVVRANSTGLKLGAPAPTPWKATLKGPVGGDRERREFVVFPTMRESNRYFVEWRIRSTCDGSDSGWFSAGLHLDVADDNPACDLIEVEVRVDDGYDNDQPRFTPVKCLAYSYSRDEVRECE